MARTPAFFIGHGSPMNAIEDNAYRRAWSAAARAIPKPRAVLCVSAHWETAGVAVTASEWPETIHDFYGFPKELFAVRYPAPGDPWLCRETAAIVKGTAVAQDPERGLDHGAWSVLAAMYPEADVPVVQLGLDTRRPASFHYALGRELAPLREQGVLILGSGNMVHNLGKIDFQRSGGYDWAVRFDGQLRRRILAGDHEALIDYESLGAEAPLAIPTPEHYLPLLYVLALQREGEGVALFNEETLMGSISMTSVALGEAGHPFPIGSRTGIGSARS
jgi:4,5-DOPA dioxygenase extradiol